MRILAGSGGEFGGAGVCFIHADRDDDPRGGGDGGDHGDAARAEIITTAANTT